MTLILRPNGLAVGGGPKSYTVELPDRALAVLDKVDGKGWELTLRPGSGQIVHRGLFRTPQDVLGVLEAEFPTTTQPDPPTFRLQPGSRNSPPTP